MATSAYGLLLGNNTGEVPLSSAVDDDQDDIEANGTDDCTDEELTRVTDTPRGDHGERR